jgi:hypothetical protein
MAWKSDDTKQTEVRVITEAEEGNTKVVRLDVSTTEISEGDPLTVTGEMQNIGGTDNCKIVVGYTDSEGYVKQEDEKVIILEKNAKAIHSKTFTVTNVHLLGDKIFAFCESYHEE